jgi:hypothetical protein
MNPSDTPRGMAWLANFEEDEQVAARLLLNGLDLVGQDRLRTDLTALIESLATQLPPTIALVPVRELAENQSYYRGDRNSTPSLLLPGSFPGSEAIVANLAGSLRRGEQSAGPFVATPSLPNMRAARCRTVLYVEDFSGSGGRILNFDRGFRRHPTIKSWLSLKWIDIHVALFAATERALARLEAHFGVDRVHVHRICPTFESRPWTRDEREGVRALCRKYRGAAEYIGPYGYQDSKGMMAFVHSVPNNLPPVLWQRRGLRVGRWSSFFQGQSVPTELHPLFGDALPEQRAEDSLLRLGQQRLAKGDWRGVAGGDTTRILLVLAALSRRPADITRIMDLTGLAASEVRDIIVACRKWALVGDTLRLTDAGLKELGHAKSVKLRDEIPVLHGSDDNYYPRSLRVGR